MKKRKIIHPLDREYKYKENDTFYLIDTEANILVSQPIYKCVVRHVNPKEVAFSYYPRKVDYCYVTNTGFGYCNENQMYDTLEKAKKAYWKSFDKQMAELTKEYNEKYGELLNKMCFIFNYTPPDYIPPKTKRNKSEKV